MALPGVLVALLAAALPGLGCAAETPDVSPGRHIAETWCAGCHAIDRGVRVSPRRPAPSFWLLSRDPAATSTAIRVLLQTPHKTMPNVRFSPEETEALIDYIHSLSRARP